MDKMEKACVINIVVRRNNCYITHKKLNKYATILRNYLIHSTLIIDSLKKNRLIILILLTYFFYFIET